MCTEATIVAFFFFASEGKEHSKLLSKSAMWPWDRPYSQNKFVREGKYLSLSYHCFPFLSSGEGESTFLLRV